MWARGPRRWSGQGAGRPRGPSAAVLPGPLAPRVCLGRCPGVPGRRGISTRRERPGVGGGEGSRSKWAGVWGEDPCDPRIHTQALFASECLPRHLGPGTVSLSRLGRRQQVSPETVPPAPPSWNPALAVLPSFGVSRGRTPARALRRAARWTAPSGLLDPRTPRLDGVSSERCQAITLDTRLWLDEELTMRVCL